MSKPRRVRLRQGALLAVVLVVSAMALSCFSQPVRQRIELYFNSDGSAEIAVITRIDAAAYDARNPALEERLARLGDDTIHAEDRWSRALHEAGPNRERRSYEFSEGKLVFAIREVLLEAPGALEKIFSDAGIGAFVEREGRRMSLELNPGVGSRATERQERRVLEEMDKFSRVVAFHLDAMGELYEYMEENPDRARVCMGALMDFEEEVVGEPLELDDLEQEIVQRASESATTLTEILSAAGDDAAYTLDELSQMVFSPLPGPLSVEVEGEILELEGFERLPDGRFGIPELGLWGALTALHDRWLSPLPVVEMINVTRADEDRGEDTDDSAFFESLMSRARIVGELPAHGQVGEALRGYLNVRDVYWISWMLPPTGEEAVEENRR